MATFDNPSGSTPLRFQKNIPDRDKPTSNSPHQDFGWLADLQNSPCYTEFNASHPAKSADFGSNGFTGSVTDWHELLQITAPDDRCGLVFVRGDHPNTPDSILARSQRHDDSGSKGTFGLHLFSKCDFELGERITHGMANFKWPYTQYELKRKTRSRTANDKFAIGTYEMLSFAMNGSIFQVIRVKPGKANKFSTSSPNSSKEALESGHSRNESTPGENSSDRPSAEQDLGRDSTQRKVADSIQDAHGKGTIRFSIGGRIQFGCICSNGGHPYTTKHLPDSRGFQPGAGMYCTSSYYDKQLMVEMFVDGKLEDLCPDLTGNPGKGAFLDISAKSRTFSVSSENPTTIVCVYSLRNGPSSQKTPTPVSSLDIESFLGIKPRSLDMIDRLWAACVLPNYDVDEADEVCAIARNVEQILCVSSIPVNLNTTPTRDGHSTPALQHTQGGIHATQDPSFNLASKTPIALLRNIMTSQYVDLQSSFWQLRFLVKVRLFLGTRSLKQGDLLDYAETNYIKRVRSRYLLRIDSYISSILLWVTEIDLDNDDALLPTRNESSSRHFCRSRQLTVSPDNTYNQNWYTTIMLWYVLIHCPCAITEDFKQRTVVPWLCRLSHLAIAKKDYRDDGLGETESRKANLLQWYHASCFTLICQNLLPEVLDSTNRETLTVQALQMDQFKLGIEATVKRWRKGQNEVYSMADEEVDRLILLGHEELEFIAESTTLKLAEVRATQVRARITERKYTEAFLPGPTISTQRKRPSRMLTNSPWELALLNHHTSLRINLKDNSTSSVDRPVRNACFSFILADYTFMTSWDRSSKDMIGQWWDFEPISVLCATIIDLKMQGKLKTAPSEFPEKTPAGHRSLAPTLPDTPSRSEGPNAAEATALLDIISEWRRDRTARQDIGHGSSNRKYDWIKRKPARQYFPEAWIRSIDDTPGHYQSDYTIKVPLGPRIAQYLRSKNDMTPPQYSKDNIRRELRQHDIGVLSVVDFTLNEDFTYTKERTSFQISSAVTEREKMMLIDSLVDLGTKHRIMLAQRCCPSIVKAFHYLWHPDARDTFDNHFGTSSRFADTKEAIWTTTITLSHWTFKPDTQAMFDEARENNGKFPPLNVRRPTPRADQDQLSDVRNDIEESCSSLTITGDQHGYFWICSAWSTLTTDKDFSQELEKLPRLLKVFLYQQASGRNLVFLLLLGHLCEKLQEKYRAVLWDLDQFVGLGPKAMTVGLDWRTDTEERLDSMFWAQEALRILDVSVSSALSEIERAKEKMDRTIKRDAGQLHIDILQEYSNVMADFEQQYLGLVAIRTEMQLKKQQVTSLRDSISTLTNVTDNRTTIKQGKNIKILTRITIAYLPFSLITGLFSVDPGLHILPENSGIGLFFGLIVLCVVVTEFIALSIWERWNLQERVLQLRRSEPKGSDPDLPRFYKVTTAANPESSEGT